VIKVISFVRNILADKESRCILSAAKGYDIKKQGRSGAGLENNRQRNSGTS
jgi:hypothetical protein